MTSTVRSSKRAAGFTLLEIVIVLTIAGIIMAGAVGLMLFSSEERMLKDVSSEVELMAKQARVASVLQQTPYALEFREGVVRLMPLAEAGREETKTVGGHRIGGETEKVIPGDRREYKLDPNAAILVRRWNSEKWLPTTGKTIHVWRFDPNGLCEPLGVRITIEQSWSEMTFNPLTAAISTIDLEAR